MHVFLIPYNTENRLLTLASECLPRLNHPGFCFVDHPGVIDGDLSTIQDYRLSF